MEYEIAKTFVRGLSSLSEGDIKESLKADMVNGQCIQIIAPKYSKSGKGEMIVWLEHA